MVDSHEIEAENLVSLRNIKVKLGFIQDFLW